MLDKEKVAGGNLDPAQAAELAVLVDLEARWENLRTSSVRPLDALPNTQHLKEKQKAYEAFSIRLAEYNKRYRPAHIPELLLNNPARLGRWCQAMRNLYIRVEHDPRGFSPVHLLEKAYWWADRVADKNGMGRVSRSMPQCTIGAAIRELEALGQWCDDLAQVVPVK
jgi:hypothetical protein